MPGPAPKPAHLRQRRNRKPGAAVIEAPVAARVPRLPDVAGREWHPLTRAWWRNVWRSPMAGEYLDTDRDGLGRLAMLVDDYYVAPNVKLAAEIRQQEARFGLSPVDRSRLQWEVQKGEEAQSRRRPQPSPGGAVDAADDPRQALRVVS